MVQMPPGPRMQPPLRDPGESKLVEIELSEVAVDMEIAPDSGADLSADILKLQRVMHN